MDVFQDSENEEEDKDLVVDVGGDSSPRPKSPNSSSAASTGGIVENGAGCSHGGDVKRIKKEPGSASGPASRPSSLPNYEQGSSPKVSSGCFDG